MGSLDHSHVVGTVSNGEQDRLLILLYELDDESFLQRRDSTADDGLAHDGQFQEDLGCFLLQRVCQALAIDNQGELLGITGITLVLYGEQSLVQKLRGSFTGLLVHNNQIHRLGNQSARKTNVDRGLLSITGQHPDLDPSLLQGVDRIGNPVLKLVFDSCSTEKEQILFDDLCDLFQTSHSPS